jgi:hypothetical protein
VSEPVIPERLGWKTPDERAETIEAAGQWESRALAAEAKVDDQAGTIARLQRECLNTENRRIDLAVVVGEQAATIELLTTERDSSREASQQALKQWRESSSQVERMRKVVLMYKSAHGTCSMVRYDPCDFCIAADAALNPQPSQPEYTSESMVQPKEKP